MSEKTDDTEYEAAFRHGVAGAQAERLLKDDWIALVPEGTALASIERYKARPYRIRQKVAVPDLESFREYLHRFGDKEGTVVFADVRVPVFRAFIDFHRKDRPSWCEHRLELELRFSEEWRAWTHLHGQMLPHLAFAEFLEDRSPDIVEPDAASVLEVAQGLQVDGSAKVVSVQSLSGAKRVVFEESETVRAAREGVEAPERLHLSIPVFERFELQPVPVRLVYRAKSRQLMIGVRIPDRQRIVSDLFDEILDEVRDAGWPVLLGESSGAQ